MKKFLIMIMLLAPSLLKADNLTITAEDKVEWHNKENKMIAIGNAVAKNESMQINAKKLEATYIKVNGKNELSKVFGYNDVILTSDKAKGYGDQLEYDVKKDEAILIGKPAIIKTQSETIEAKENIYYYPGQKKAVAKGGVKSVNKEGNEIYSDELVAYFKESNNSSMELYKVDIFDNIKVVSKDATVTADTGTYYPTSGKLHLFDNVVIYQDDNTLKGDKAVANLHTGVSKMLAGSKGKVKGTFRQNK